MGNPNHNKLQDFPEAKPIKTHKDNWFAWDTMVNRLPKNIRNICTLHDQDFSPLVLGRLTQLADEISTNQPIPPLPKLVWDYDRWEAEAQPFLGKGWHQVDWFFAETYAFRLVLEATDYFSNGIDPFSEGKRRELESGSPFFPIKRHLEFIQSLTQNGLQGSLPTGNHETMANYETRVSMLAEAIHTCMWGNKADLSFSAGGDLDHSQGDRDLLLVNHEQEAAALLVNNAAEVHIIMDNSGAELGGDLVIAGTILDTTESRVVLRPKLYPTYVSDTIAKDVFIFLQKAEYHPDEAICTWAKSIRRYMDQGRLIIAPDDFWCRTRFMVDADRRIKDSFSTAGLVVVKGDFNYRRFMRDTIWPAQVSSREALALSSSDTLARLPMLFLRTMKSDCLAGIDSKLVSKLDSEEPGWRIQGKRGLIQLVRAEQ